MTGSLKPKLVSVTPYEIAALPEWVEVSEYGDVPPQHTDSPQVFNLVDYQMRIDSNRSANFTRLSFTILDASRVDEGSQFLYEVVPGAQHVVFHSCVIHRGESTINALNADNIRAVQRERELENHISTGRVTVELILDDVRVGDTIDLSVTQYDLVGEHPLYGHYFQAKNWLSWGVPVLSQKLRVQNESDGAIYFREIDSEQEVDRRESILAGGSLSREWNNLPMRENTPGVPLWFWPPIYFVTSESSWQGISEYLYNYYGTQGVWEDDITLSDIEGIDWQDRSEATVRAVIDFVQNSVRYRGESDGIYSHTPKSPAKTLKKRSGDCKDKSNLLRALLAKLDIDAQLVLVNTRLTNEVSRMDPSPFMFDHMVVRFEFDGAVLFVDPTLQKQGGTLANRTKLEYGQALVLSPTNGRLEALPKPGVADLFKLKHIVDLRDVDAPTLTIERVFHGERADNMRSYFSSRERSQYQDEFESYAKEHINASLKCIDGIVVEHDCLETNYVNTIEKYALILDDGEIENDNMQIYTSFAEQLEIVEDQKFAQEITLDGELNHHIHVMYPYKPSVDEDKFSKSTKWFEYKDVTSVDGNNLHFRMTVKPLTNEVAAGELEQYQTEVTDVKKRCVSQFGIKKEKSDAEVGALIAAMLALLIAFQHLPLAVFAIAFIAIGLIAMRETIAGWLKPFIKK